MTLRSLPALLRDEPVLADVLGATTTTLTVPEVARAIFVAGLAEISTRHPIVVATPTSTEAERLAHDLRVFCGEDGVDVFPAWETLPFERVSPAVETMGRRLRTIWHLTDPDQAPRIVVAPIRALVQRLGPHVEDIAPVIIRAGSQVDQEGLVSQLIHLGYRREYQVEHRGEVAVRGSIVDVFPSTADQPVRIDLWGDEVDRLSEFSVADQRSTTERTEVHLFACRELLPTEDVRERAAALLASEPWGREQWDRLAEGQTFDGMESWLPWLAGEERLLADLLPDNALMLLVEPARMRDRAADLLADETDLATTLAQTWEAGDRAFPQLHLDFDRLLAHTDAPVWSLTPVPEGPSSPEVKASAWDPVIGDGAVLAKQLQGLLADDYRLVIAADGDGSADRMVEVLAEHDVLVGRHTTDDDPLPAPRTGLATVAPLERGFILPGAKLAVLTERDITGRRRAHRPARPRQRDARGFFDDLKEGDYVVHHQHGVARYGGMVRRAIAGHDRDYLVLEYRSGDRLYVPSDQIDVVRHYTGGDSPSLSRLNGSDWQKTKARVRSAVAEIAQELVVLYQKRITSPGTVFGLDTPWQHELEAAFPYRETPDQLAAIEAVKADMEAPAPMDRLVCGDVGFGKTEVAIRAAFKAVQEGKQVAVLVPTTLLAQQHGQTFGDRLAPYPIRVEVLSRFLTTGQQKAVIEGIGLGSVDLVIGTHRLLSGDVRFANLGLLIVDEEQRFGVSHKEAIKEFRADVDVLTLSATPIPRTLEMSLTGIRDLSIINTPPADRQPILTYVGDYDERAVAESIRRELLREGQVFFVHNRVEDIEHVARGLQELVPEARIAIAHGQMDEGSLERVVIDFWEGQYDVLVCTTIIESGIDMPTVNTLVVDRADLLGLGQLHQIRGRVGRAGQRAYAYLFTPPDRSLSEDAYERLRTIGESTELGSGFKIAMRDLEMRGAGNLLGTGQSGHIAAVGYDLYCQMVTEAVAELKGEEVREPAEVKLDLPLDANLSADYVPKEELRLEAYRRLASVTDPAQVADIQAEWEDRYGPVPDAASALLDVARLRAVCQRAGVTDVVVTRNQAFSGPSHVAKLGPVELAESKQVRLQRLLPKAVYKEDTGELQVPVSKPEDVAPALIALLDELVPATPLVPAGA